MTPNPPSLTVIYSRSRASCAMLLAAFPFLFGGCMTAKKRPAIRWQTASIVHPLIPSPRSTYESTLPEVTSIPALELPPPHITFLPAHPVPVRPRVPAQPPASGDAKDDGPLIVPQLTAEESASAQQEANASLAVAERNLEAVRGKTLNAGQTDMSNKVKSFMNDAREAARVGDWTRARGLAKKAQVISDELAHSLH
jgi:hypothetical protein